MKSKSQHSNTESRASSNSRINRKASSSLILNYRIPRSTALAILAALSAIANAGQGPDFMQPPAGGGSTDSSAFDQLWDLATIYKDDSNPILQELKLRGRYHGQYHFLDSDQGNEDAWEDRRSRLGFDAKLFGKQVELRADFQSNDGFEDPYDRIVDAYIRWKPSPDLAITAGKTKPLVGYHDWLPSTNCQATFERSQIFNQLGVDRATGLTVEWKTGAFTWQTGVYSNDMDREFGQFGGDMSYGAGVGYDAKETIGWKRADFRLDWLHSGHDADDGVMLNYDDILSATFWGQEGPWSLVVEGFLGSGQTAGAGDVFGFYIQPTYQIIPEKLQLVGRYSFATGDGDESVVGQRRYERAAPDLIPLGTAKGDRYHALYLGAQYFIHGDKLKLMAGAEYAKLDGGSTADDFDGLTWLTGIRFSF
jgi:hypothetical protein